MGRQESEGLAGPRWTNCPPEVQSRLLALHRRCQTASLGAKRHFIYPEVDELLDEWLDHETFIDWSQASPAAD